MSSSEQKELILKPEQLAALKEGIPLASYGLQQIQKMPYINQKRMSFQKISDLHTFNKCAILIIEMGKPEAHGLP